MKIALDPYMFRTTPLTELPGLAWRSLLMMLHGAVNGGERCRA
jgi:hypothetical protein